MPNPFTKSNLPYFAVATSALIWGAASPVFKWSLTNIPTFTLAYLRFAIASLILLPFVYKKLYVKKEDRKTIIALGLLGVTLNITFFFLGLERTSSLSSSIIIALEPVFIVLASIYILKEKPKNNVWYGIAISLTGFLVIIYRAFTSPSSGSIIGDLFILMATFTYVGQTILIKKIADKYDSLTVTFWMFIVGTVTFLPMFTYEALQPVWLENLDIRGVAGIGFGAFLSSAAGYFLYNWGIRRIQMNKSAVLNYLNPISGILIAIPLLHEKITFTFLIGALLIFTGVYITQRHHHQSH